MERAGGLADFQRRTSGRFLAEATWLHGSPGSGLFCVVLFGRPDRTAAERLARSLAVELGPGVAPHRSLVDASRIDGVDAGAFEVLSAYVRAHHAKLSERVTRLAMVRPSGIEGAVVAGFFRVLDPPYPVAVFEAAPEALEWLGEAPAGLAAELDRLVGEARGLAPTVGALRAWLAPRRSAGIEEACAALGLSARTLQRRLREGGTSWQREVQAARIADAERRMLDTDDPLTAIALDAGFASLQHFSGLFRKARGASPSSWRAQRRRGGER